MKILILSDDFPPTSFGGAGIVAFNQATELSRRGHAVHVLTTTRERKEEGSRVHEGMIVHAIHTHYHERWRSYLSLYNPQTISKVAKIISEFKPDVVHAHNIHYYLSYYSLCLARQYAKKVFLTTHDAMLVSNGKIFPINALSAPGQDIQYKVSTLNILDMYGLRFNPLKSVGIKYCLRSVDKIFAVSYALKNVLEVCGIGNIEVMHNGIDSDAWQVPVLGVDEAKQKFGLQQKKVVLFGGRVTGAKGGLKMLEAMREVIIAVPETVLLILGKKDAYTEKLAEVAEEYGLTAHIIWAGWVSGNDLKNVYWMSDVVVVPSIYLDPFPNTNLEAIACHRPVIGTCFGGTTEVIEDGKTGFVVNPNNVATLASKITTILKNSDLARTMGEAGYERVKKEFNLGESVEKLLKWY